MFTAKKMNQGFTLIEIIVVMAILGFIISFGMVMDWNVIGRDTFSAEQSKIVAILEKTRSRAIANIFESPHGVCYVAPNYIIFRGTCGGAFTESIPANTNMTITFPNIVFDQLTGNLIPAFSGTEVPCLLDEKKISFDYQGRVANICINNEGRINW